MRVKRKAHFLWFEEGEKRTHHQSNKRKHFRDDNELQRKRPSLMPHQDEDGMTDEESDTTLQAAQAHKEQRNVANYDYGCARVNNFVFGAKTCVLARPCRFDLLR